MKLPIISLYCLVGLAEVSSPTMIGLIPQVIEIISGRGEIGKHKGLKIPRLKGLAGSSPAARTTFSGPLKLTLWLEFDGYHL